MIGFSLKSAILVVIVTIASVQCDGWFQRCPDPSTIYDIDINAVIISHFSKLNRSIKIIIDFNI